MFRNIAATIIIFLSGIYNIAKADDLKNNLEIQRKAFIRIHKITDRILAANSDKCDKKNYLFGVYFYKPEFNKIKKVKKGKKFLYQIDYSPRIITFTDLAKDAQKDFKIGDYVNSINGVKWVKNSDNTDFVDELGASSDNEYLNLTIIHNGKSQKLKLHGKQACDASFNILSSKLINAWTIENVVTITTSIETILQDDDELAYVLSHEIAHVIFKHAGAEKMFDIYNYPARGKMEKDADEFAIRFMSKAGFDPNKAPIAIKRITDANRNVLTNALYRFGFELNGPYMREKERIEFLTKIAKEVQNENQKPQ